MAEHPQTRADLEVHDIDGELIVIGPDGRAHRLDPVASVLWPLFDGTATIGELAADVGAAFGIAAVDAAPQLDALLQQLDRAGLLVGSSPPLRRATDTLGFLTDPPSP